MNEWIEYGRPHPGNCWALVFSESKTGLLCILPQLTYETTTIGGGILTQQSHGLSFLSGFVKKLLTGHCGRTGVPKPWNKMRQIYFLWWKGSRWTRWHARSLVSLPKVKSTRRERATHLSDLLTTTACDRFPSTHQRMFWRTRRWNPQKFASIV